MTKRPPRKTRTAKNQPVYRLSNHGLGRALTPSEKTTMLDKIEHHMAGILDALGIQHRHDHNTADTPRRVAKAYVEELFVGLHEPPPKVTSFSNVANFDQLICVCGITVNSTCAHHFLPFMGTCHIAVLPGAGKPLIGLSKYARIVHHFSSRPQIQEELVRQIADYLQEIIEPRALAVRISSQHLCACARGVREPNLSMVTTDMRGEFLSSDGLRQEFLREISAHEARK